MPCYRCGTRQSDPEAGKASPWKRGVLAGHQVLICPDCLSCAVPELDGCARCGGVHLIRRLDQIECLDCRHIREAAPEPPSRQPPSGTAADPAAVAARASPRGKPRPSGLADEVARALDRVLGHG